MKSRRPARRDAGGLGPFGGSNSPSFVQPHGAAVSPPRTAAVCACAGSAVLLAPARIEDELVGFDLIAVFLKVPGCLRFKFNKNYISVSL